MSVPQPVVPPLRPRWTSAVGMCFTAIIFEFIGYTGTNVKSRIVISLRKSVKPENLYEVPPSRQNLLHLEQWGQQKHTTSKTHRN